MTDWLTITPDGLLISVQAQPGASRDAVDGVVTRDDGRSHLRLKVRAQPQDGEANRALAVLIAKAAGVAKSAVRLESGATARRKRFHIATSDAEAVAAALKTAATGKNGKA